MFKIGDLARFAHLSGAEPGVVECVDPGGSVMVRWPDATGSWHRPSDLTPVESWIPPVNTIKPNYADLPFDALEEVCLVFQLGAGKYGKDDWAKPDNQSGDHVHKALGHIVHHLRGSQRETGENGSGYRHLSHAAARLLMAIGKELRNP